ncbi:MAG TPA: 50S ribosomal protein L3 [Candidatus Paceibacterota bacterium]|nr:50S ribosomal protein L3 [Candidatus Paceibacterota bacterium]
MKFILARKIEMTRVFGEDGRAHAGTVLAAAPVVVTQVKTAAGADKYDAVQVGEGSRKAKNVSKAVLGHTKSKAFSALREFRVPSEALAKEGAAAGAEITVEAFAVGDSVVVSGLSKGKGFAGVVKRHGFHGGRRSHGQKHSEREPGSIGGSGGRAGGRVAKGIRMAGRLGGARVTVKNLKVLAVDAANHRLIVSGAVPGARGTLLEVVSA